MNGRFGVISAKFRTCVIVFLIIDSSEIHFPTMFGGIFFPHIKDTKFPTNYQSNRYKVFYFFATVPIVSNPDESLVGRFVYGKVSHRHLVEGYVKVHVGGWCEKDDEKKTILLYDSSGDYGEPRLDFLNRTPCELKDYIFLFSPDWRKTTTKLASDSFLVKTARFCIKPLANVDSF